MRYNIIAIEREYASGGHEIGCDVAEKLRIPCYGIEILEMVSKKYGVSMDSLYELEENTTNSLLYSIGLLSRSASADYIKGLAGLSNTDALYIAEMNIIRELAVKEPCILIGHCAGVALSERDDVLRLFIYADRDIRKSRAIENYGLQEKEVDSVLRKIDRRRANYYNAHSNSKWNEREGYHIMLNSGKLGINICSDIIRNAALV